MAANLSVKTIVFGAMGVMLFMSAVSYISLERWTQKAKSDATVVNMAGRQRMLSQKMLKEAQLVRDGVIKKETFDKTVALFDVSLLKLINGDVAMGTGAAPLEVTGELQTVQSEWQTYLAMLETVLTSKPGADGVDLSAVNAQSMLVLKHSNNAVKIYEEIAKQKVAALKFEAISIFFASLVVAFLAFYLVKRFVVSRLLLLRDTIVRTEKTMDLSLLADIDGQDEITAIAMSFNAMLGKFKDVTAKLQAMIEQSELGVQDFDSITSDTLSSMHEQNEALDSVATASEELSASFNAVTDNVGSTVDAAKLCSEESDAGYRLGRESVTVINDLGEAFCRTSEAINTLGNDSQAIGSILDTIRNIAEQTNLLALNAAIEAARAGEQGRGFAVVADEVRTLAQRTQSATQEIHELIDSLINGVKATVATVEAGQQKVNESVSNAERVQNALQTIKEKIDHTLLMSEDIQAATTQQRQALGDVTMAMGTVSDRAKSTLNKALSARTLNEGLLTINKEMHVLSDTFHV